MSGTCSAGEEIANVMWMHVGFLGQPTGWPWTGFGPGYNRAQSVNLVSCHVIPGGTPSPSYSIRQRHVQSISGAPSRTAAIKRELNY
jgi:hypothetical protein